MAYVRLKNGMPKRLNERHKLAALLIATGKRRIWVCRRLGMAPNRLSVIQQSPLFRVLVEQYQREFISQGMQTTINKVLADGPANVEFLRKVRDGMEPDVKEIDDPNDRMRHRLKAAESLFDRQLPRRMETESQASVHVTVEATRRELAEDACAEVGAPIDITPVSKVPRLAPPVAVLVPKALDDVIAEYEAREVME